MEFPITLKTLLWDRYGCFLELHREKKCRFPDRPPTGHSRLSSEVLLRAVIISRIVLTNHISHVCSDTHILLLYMESLFSLAESVQRIFEISASDVI